MDVAIMCLSDLHQRKKCSNTWDVGDNRYIVLMNVSMYLTIVNLVLGSVDERSMMLKYGPFQNVIL